MHDIRYTTSHRFNSFHIVYLRIWNNLLRKHFYQNFSNLISKLSDVICDRCSCISLNFTFTFNAEQENHFFACNKMLVSRMNSPCVAVFLQIDFEKTSIEEKKYVTQHPTVFLLFKQQLLFMVIKKTGKWSSKWPLRYCRNVSNASWLNLFFHIECFWIQTFKHIILLVRNSPPST